MPNWPSPRIFPSCAAPRIRRKWWRRADELGLAAIGIADRNSFAGVVRAYDEAKKRKIKLLVGTRLVTIDGFEALAYPTDREAYGRLCRLVTTGNLKAKKGECHLTFEDILAASEGQMLIAMPPRTSRRRSIFTDRLSTLARAAPGRTFLAGIHHHRGDEPRRLGLLAELGERAGCAAGRRQRRFLSCAGAPAACRCRSPACARNARSAKPAFGSPSMPSGI